MLPIMEERIQKLLADAGIESRRQVEEMALSASRAFFVLTLITTFNVSCEKPTSTGFHPSTAPDWTEASDYPQNVQKITRLEETAATSQPSSADVSELFDQALHDPDFRIRVRAMAVFPYLRDREKAIDVLITCTHDHDPATSGDGNVPLYAALYLADMGAVRAIPDVKNWIDFLNANPKYFTTRQDQVLKQAIDDLERLKHAASTRPAS